MQSSLEFFCEECGAANVQDATYCIACKELLFRSPIPSMTASIQPVVIVSTPKLEVTAEEAVSDILLPGTLLENRYQIVREIGQGGYSIVYKATDTRRHNRAVTIKQINLQNLTARQIIDATETFNREITFLPLLKHKGIPKFYGHFTDPQHWYLVMEYISGHTLEEYLQKVTKGGYCSPKDTLKLGIALSSILEYLHMQREPVIFRDVKPANIMLTRIRKLYLIDFGIARSFDVGKAKDTTPLGSPGYAAPEQYGRSQSDMRTDIYGLGATLQTLLTGRDPLELRAHPSRASHPIPTSLQKLLDAMMNPVANLRPQSMIEVKRKLQDVLAGIRRLPTYCMGLTIGLIYFAWGYLTVRGNNLINSIEFGYSNGPSRFSLAFLREVVGISGFFWLLVTIVGVIFLILSLFLPARRFLAFGVLTIMFLAIILLTIGSFHL